MLCTEAISHPLGSSQPTIRGSRASAKLVHHVAAYVAAPTPLAPACRLAWRAARTHGALAEDALTILRRQSATRTLESARRSRRAASPALQRRAAHDAEAVMLDLVNPITPGRRLIGAAGQAGFDALQLALQLTRRGHGSRVCAATLEWSRPTLALVPADKPA